MDHSTSATTFNQVMKDAKRHYNIPKNQSPERKETNLDRRGENNIECLCL